MRLRLWFDQRHRCLFVGKHEKSIGGARWPIDRALSHGDVLPKSGRAMAEFLQRKMVATKNIRGARAALPGVDLHSNDSLLLGVKGVYTAAPTCTAASTKTTIKSRFALRIRSSRDPRLDLSLTIRRPLRMRWPVPDLLAGGFAGGRNLPI